MTREEYLQKIASDLCDISDEEKDTKERRALLKKDFFRLLEEGYKGREHILPVKTIEVPAQFWNETGMGYKEFTSSRFPGWDVEHIEKNIVTGDIVFVLKRDPHFLPGVVEVGETIKVSKEVSEYTPEIDWESLQQERPDLFEKLSKPVVTLEIDDDAFERLAMEEPEELATLERHMRMREPVLKVRSRRTKDAE